MAQLCQSIVVIVRIQTDLLVLKIFHFDVSGSGILKVDVSHGKAVIGHLYYVDSTVEIS